MYLTTADYLDRFGQIETVRLTDEERTGSYDSAKLEEAIGDAQEEVDSYLGKRYSTPLSTVPNLVKGFVAILGRENLYRRAGMAVSPALEKDAERVRSQLRDIARGTMILPTESGPAEQNARDPADSASSGEYVGPVFSDETLSGFGVPGVGSVANWRA